MARAFESVIRLQMQKYSPEEARKRHIEAARRGLAAFVSRQESRPTVRIETDGHPSSTESTVKPFGVIVYRFTRLKEIVGFAKAEAMRLSPKGGAGDPHPGRYRNSWFAMIDGAEIDIRAIPPNATEVVLTNDQPYSRKINVGAKGFEKYAPPGVVEKVKELVKRRYGALVDVRVVFLTLAGGHVLKRDQYRKDRKGRRSARPRRDARAGMDLTYPAIRITPK